ITEIEKLFLDNMDAIFQQEWLKNELLLAPQDERFASFHRKSDLPEGINWDENIVKTFERLLLQV
ncbi:MAG: hypothetical protein LBP51_01415, partial [Deferribacteraceae bacterium]|nr:hypothetical protein [Deferribacteraceae bacterium]